MIIVGEANSVRPRSPLGKGRSTTSKWPGRRPFLLFGPALAVCLWPAASNAQDVRKVPRLGVLSWEGCPGPGSVFGRALSERGYRWGETVRVVCRSAGGSYEALSEAAAALARDQVELLVGLSHISAFALRRATTSIPIVMIASGDPVKTGLVDSLARPGGNVTGVSYYSTELTDKRLQLLREIVPMATRVAVLTNSLSDHAFGMYREDALIAARRFGIQPIVGDVRDPRELAPAFEGFATSGAQALMVLVDPMLRAEARQIAELALRHKLPAIYPGPWFLEAGGLASFSADFDQMTGRVAYYIDRILKGTPPGNLPVEQPTRFELVLNLKAAKAFGLTIPQTLMARTDRLIEH